MSIVISLILSIVVVCVSVVSIVRTGRSVAHNKRLEQKAILLETGSQSMLSQMKTFDVNVYEFRRTVNEIVQERNPLCRDRLNDRQVRSKVKR
jgi:hypothetical protein